MASAWLRVETDRPSRYLSPSVAPPPTLEGIDKLHQPPLSLRSMSTHRSNDGLSGENQPSNVFVHIFQGEEKLGNVSVAVGGQQVAESEAVNLQLFAIQALRSSNVAGATLMFDCAASFETNPPVEPPSKHCELPNGNCRYLPTTNSAERTREQALETSDGVAILRAPFYERFKPQLLHFLSTSAAIPLSPNFCVLLNKESVKYYSLSDKAHYGEMADDWMIVTVAHLATKSTGLAFPKSMTSLGTKAAKIARAIFFSVSKMLSCAFAETPLGDFAQCCTLLAGDSPLFFIAAFSLSGLVFSSSSFFAVTSHWERMLLAVVAIDQLIVKKQASPDGGGLNSIRVIDFPLRMSRSADRKVMHVVVISVGSGASFVICFKDLKQSGPEGTSIVASVFLKWITEKIAAFEGLLKPQSSVTESVPLFVGLHGRAGKPTAALASLETCLVEPTDPSAAKLLDDGSNSDEGNDDGTTCGCFAGDSSPWQRALRRKIDSSHAQSWENVVCRAAASVRRTEEKMFASLLASGVQFMSTVVCSRDAVPAPSQLESFSSHRYQAFECAWWRHLLVNAVQPSFHATVRDLQDQCTSLQQLVGNTRNSTNVALLEASNNALFECPDGLSIVTHGVVGEGVVSNDPCCSAAVTVGIAHPREVARDVEAFFWLPDFELNGFEHSATSPPLSKDAWRGVQALSQLTKLVTTGAFLLQAPESPASRTTTI